MGAGLIRDPPTLQPLNPWRLVPRPRPTPAPAIVPSLATLVLLVILAFGAVGSWYLHERAERTVVIVAAHDLPAFHQIRALDLKEAKLAAGASTPSRTERPPQIIGKYTLATVPKGKPLTAGDLGPTITAGALQRSIIVGLDASPSATLGGRLQRGLVSDVLLLSDEDDAAAVTLRHVRVLDVAPSKGSSGTWTVVVAVPLAQRLLLKRIGGMAPLFLVADG